MRKFKIIYYAIYISVVVIIFYVAGNILSILETLKYWGWYSYFSELPSLGSNFFYFIAVFMFLAMCVEIFFTYQKGKEAKDLKNQIQELKAKLYDQGSITHEPTSATFIEDNLPEEENSDDQGYNDEGDEDKY